MFDFDDYEDLGEYCFEYPAREVIECEYQIYLRKHKDKKPYKEFVIDFVKERILLGYRKLREIETEWEKLKYYIEEPDITTEKAIILYDQVLQLLYEGHPLPPNIKY